ncbi:alpha/beta hydrolase [Pseudoxanthomonas suwonensis]|uniref:alpha/beta hydrolase n=1 Tax=Pseudoxanthomonas suwonensis TaxID=314722 RepID=UPI000697D309|nr:alpha/beta hydrolase [Pseudoxanthomonas suwonensis]
MILRRILRLLAWLLLALVLLVGAGLAWMKLSPVPAVMLIRHHGAFSEVPGSLEAQTLLASGEVTVLRDVGYAPGGGNPDTRMDVYRPGDASAPLPAVVWVHGGGFIDGTKDALEAYLPQLAVHGYVGIAIEYSKAPEQRYPVQVRQVMQALHHLQAHAEELHVDPSRIVLGGDSAGAHIAAQAALAIVDPDYAQATGLAPTIAANRLRGMLLFSGTYQFLVGPQAKVAPDMERFGRLVRWAYLGEKDPDPDGQVRWTTLHQLVDGRFPPTLIVAGNGDPLAPQSQRMADALQAAGVPTQWMFFDGGQDEAYPHEFQFRFDTPGATRVLEATLESLDRWTRDGTPAPVAAGDGAPPAT